MTRSSLFENESENGSTLWHASFILRCWSNPAGEVRARLIDVRTGVTHPLADLDEIPALTRRLLGTGPTLDTSIERNGMQKKEENR
jgi:hypothetical protein